MITETAPTTVKSTLARLLATENISVVHESIPTAFFDLKNRALHLPMWAGVSNNLYDMLVGHEIAHALWTPINDEDGWKATTLLLATQTGVKRETAQMYLNIVEDARIERLIKNKFPGLRNDFHQGYRTLIEKGVFGKIEDAVNGCFADRFNCHFKFGIHVGTAVSFNTEEQALVNRATLLNTWQEVIDLTRDMLLLEANKMKQEPKPQDQEEGEASDEVEFDDSDESAEDGEGESKETEESTEQGEQGKKPGKKPKSGEKTAEPVQGEKSESSTKTAESDASTESSDETEIAEPKTNEAFDKGVQGLINNDSNTYNTKVHRVNLPSTDSSDVVVDFKTILEDFRAARNTQGTTFNPIFANQLTNGISIKDYDDASQSMTMAFNRRKAADVFKRSTVAKTGNLDTLRMNMYKWTDDVFRRTTRVAEGKNHGIVILLDWSGSMNRILQSTIGQLLIITDFCRQTGIPFEVMAFTSNPYFAYTCKATSDFTYNKTGILHTFSKKFHGCSYATKQEAIDAGAYRSEMAQCSYMKSTNLLNFLSSRMNKREYNEMSALLWNFRQVTSLLMPQLNLANTPTITALHYISDVVEKFIAKNRVQIVQTVVLTDGEPTDNYDLHRWITNGIVTSIYDGDSYILQDTRTGASYGFANRYSNVKKVNYGNVAIPALPNNGMSAQHQWVALDILRRRTNTNIHWINLLDKRTIRGSSFITWSKDAGRTWSHGGFAYGKAAGWDSIVYINSNRIERDFSGNPTHENNDLLTKATDKINRAEGNRAIATAFITSQEVNNSLRSLSTVIGEFLAV